MKLNLQLFAYNGNSIVDFLNSEGKDSSFSTRKQLAVGAGITNYTGTATQNATLLNHLRGGGSGTTANAASDSSTVSKTPKSTIAGVSDATYAGMNKGFVESDETKSLGNQKNDALGGYKDHASKTDIVDQSTKNKMNSQFVTPDSVIQADSYLSKQLAQIQSGRTSYSDQLDDMISQIMNRDKFEYDADSDQLFQQALASAMNSGKSAMQDTIGQASALTGGYGSTYATSAGNQAYNAFIEDAYDNLPEYYQMALQAYQMEGQEMYQQLGMLSDADAREYGRMVDAYNATSQKRNQDYSEAYALHQDSVNNAINYANFQLNEHGQIANNLFNIYSSDLNEYENAYAKEWGEWNTGVQNAYQMAGLEQGDYWNQKNFDEGVRQFNETMAYNRSRGSGSGGGGPTDSSGGGGYAPSATQKSKGLEAYQAGGYEGLIKYVDSQKDGMDVDSLLQYCINETGISPGTSITRTEDTFNWFGGLDGNDRYTYTDANGKVHNNVKLNDLPEWMQKRVNGQGNISW